MVRSSASLALSALGIVVASSFASGCKKPALEGADASPPDAAPTVVVIDAGPSTATDVADAALEDIDAGVTAKTTTTPVVASTMPFATGETWSGRYNCGGWNTMALHITSVQGTTVNAIFDFKSKGQTGSFHMSGKYDHAAHHLGLRAGAWIAQPPRFVTIDLDGTLGADLKSYAGAALGPRCTNFTTRRM